ncbi:MAG: PEPxxWA-CTERM sorting domain-containing protein [Bradyrhizobium sp.]|uniref:PEPxxWA-CTERM sorting domain-containing protein n=1 Tax=Bradyrhizobium sp. TaxID=376 RepID=UPI003C7A24B3
MKFGNLGSQALLFTVLMALSHPAVAAPFTNGNFETPGGISFTGIGVGSGNTALLTGWTVGGPGGALQNADVFYQNSSFVGVMGISGDSSVGFGGNGSTGGTLSQTFDTVPGSNYTIDYFVTDQQGLGPQSFLVQALNGALVINSVTGSVAQTASFNWMAGPQLAFMATGASTTLRFTDTSDGAAALFVNWALDGVSLNGASPGAVPEPTTWAMLLLGFAGIGFMAYRRKSKRALMAA